MKANVIRAKPTNVTLNPDMLKEAKRLGINVSKACEKGLFSEIADKRAEEWIEENREGIAESNAYVEKYGLPLAEFRQF